MLRAVGAGSWDYLTLDSTGQRLFVSRATRVDVIDTLSGKLIRTIDGTNGVHGVALAVDLKRGFTSNGKAESVTMFDIDTPETIKEVSVPGHNPDAIPYEPVGKHVFTFNGRSKDVNVLNAVDDGEGQIRALTPPHLMPLVVWGLPPTVKAASRSFIGSPPIGTA